MFVCFYFRSDFSISSLLQMMQRTPPAMLLMLEMMPGISAGDHCALAFPRVPLFALLCLAFLILLLLHVPFLPCFALLCFPCCNTSEQSLSVVAGLQMRCQSRTITVCSLSFPSQVAVTSHLFGTIDDLKGALSPFNGFLNPWCSQKWEATP